MLPTTGDAVPQRDLSKVFVVHGHDDGARHAMARFLEKIELEAIILQEQPDQGLTIIENFESYSHAGRYWRGGLGTVTSIPRPAERDFRTRLFRREAGQRASVSSAEGRC
jgi:Predicted nucleotide-binding protein containing TIR-like domain